MILGLGSSGARIAGALGKMREAAGYEIHALDTDETALRHCGAARTMLLAQSIRDGKGCGGDPVKGQRALSIERPKIRELIKGRPLLIVAGGFGGGVATGGAAIIASEAKAAKIPVLFLVTMPFSFEGHGKRKTAEDGLKELLSLTDVVIPVPNDLLFSSVPADTPVKNAFEMADIEAARIAAGLAEISRCDNLLSADYSDFVSALKGKKSYCGAGVGHASEKDGLDKCHMALERLMESPLLGGIPRMETADVLFLVVTGGPEMNIGDMTKALESASRFAGPETKVVTGVSVDPLYERALQITAVAVTYDKEAGAEAVEKPARTLSSVKPFFKPKTPVIDKNAELVQDLLPLMCLSKGIFTNATPSVCEGEDLDVPTFQRRSIIIDKGY
jgi:cell division protein FtsZ